MLHLFFTSKTRFRLLIKFFINTANLGHMCGIAKELNQLANAIRKELTNRRETRYVVKDASQSRISYNIRPRCSNLRNA